MSTEDTHRIATLEHLVRKLQERMLPEAFLNAVLEALNDLRRPSPVLLIDGRSQEVPRCGCGAMAELTKQAAAYCSRLEALIAEDREATAQRLAAERQQPPRSATVLPFVAPSRERGHMQSGKGDRHYD